MVIILKAHNDRLLREQKRDCANNYSLAILIGNSVASILDKKNKFPKIHEAFPELFEEMQPQQQDWRLAKERMLDFANHHNQKRGETN